MASLESFDHFLRIKLLTKWLVLLFISFYFFYNTNNNDYESYKLVYNLDVNVDRFEPLFLIYNEFFRLLKFDFIEYYFFTVFFICLLYSIFLLKVDLWICFIFIVALSSAPSEQFRFYFASILLILAFSSNRNLIFRYILGFCAITMHYFMLPLLIIFFAIRSLFLSEYKVIFLLFGFSLLLIFDYNVTFLMQFLGYGNYLDSDFMNPRSFISTFITSIMIAFLYFFNKKNILSEMWLFYFFCMLSISVLLSNFSVISGRLFSFTIFFLPIIFRSKPFDKYNFIFLLFPISLIINRIYT